jgi:FkbM family methyltransferase
MQTPSLNEESIDPRSQVATMTAASVTLLDQLGELLSENARLQSQLNEVFATRLLALEGLTREGQAGLRSSLQTVEKMCHKIDSRIDQLSTALPIHFPMTASVGSLLLTRVLNRFLMYLEADDMSVTPHLIANGCWEKNISDVFIQHLKPGMTVVDVGANYGYYTLLAASVVGWDGQSASPGCVYAFEPNRKAFDILMKNIQVNWLGGIVRAHQLAVADSSKQCELHVPAHFQGCSSVLKPIGQPDCTYPEECSVVRAVRLDDIIQSKVDLMKIDAEGSEPLVFVGMSGILERSPNLTIFMEFFVPMLRQVIDPPDFLRRIRELGFSLQWFTPWQTLEPFDEERALTFARFDLLLERKQSPTA